MFNLFCTVFYLWCTIKLVWSKCNLNVSVHVFDNEFGKSGMYRSNTLMMFTCQYISADDTIVFKLMQGSGTSNNELYKTNSDKMPDSSQHQAIFYEMMSQRLEGSGSGNEMFCQCKDDKSSTVNIPAYRSCEKGLCGLSGTPEYSVCYGTITKLQPSTYGNDIWNIMEEQMWNKQSNKHYNYCTDCGTKCKTTINSIPLKKGQIQTLFTGASSENLPVATTDNAICSYGRYTAVHQSKQTAPPPPSPHPCVNETANWGRGCYWERHCTKDSYFGKRKNTYKGEICKIWNDGLWRKTYGQGEHNFCRIPDPDSRIPWCYTGDTMLGADWEYCIEKRCTASDEYVWTKPPDDKIQIDYWNPFPMLIEREDIKNAYKQDKIYVGAVYYVNTKFSILPNNRGCPDGNYEVSDMKCYLYSWEKPVNGILQAKKKVKPLKAQVSTRCENQWFVPLSEIPKDKIHMIGCIFRLKRHRWETRPENVVPQIAEYKVEFYVVNLEGAITPSYNLTSPEKKLNKCIVNETAMKVVDLDASYSCNIRPMAKENICECTFSACSPMKISTLVKQKVPLTSDMTLPPTTQRTTTEPKTRRPIQPPKPAAPTPLPFAKIDDPIADQESASFPVWAIALVMIAVLALGGLVAASVLGAFKGEKKKKRTKKSRKHETTGSARSVSGAGSKEHETTGSARSLSAAAGSNGSKQFNL